MSAVERWLPVPTWEDRYEVSDLGRVRSVGKHGRVLKLNLHKGYPVITLSRGRACRETFGVHRLVMLAFVGPKPFAGAEIRHMDGVKTNSRLNNLQYGTKSENGHDRTRLGENPLARREGCGNGHPFDVANTYDRLDGGRGCRTCRREWAREYDRRQRDAMPAPASVIRAWARANGVKFGARNTVPKLVVAAYVAAHARAAA